MYNLLTKQRSKISREKQPFSVRRRRRLRRRVVTEVLTTAAFFLDTVTRSA